MTYQQYPHHWEGADRLVLWSKIARIVMQLADELHISPERALAIFYETDVCIHLHEPAYGLHLMSDTYIVNDIKQELRQKQG